MRYDYEDDDYGDSQRDEEYFEDDEILFMNPGGNSALRAGKREFPCPTCDAPNRLCAADIKQGYQCDSCANAQERGY